MKKLIRSIKNFIYRLISSSDDTSSKRFASLFTLANIIGMSWITTIFSVEKVIPEYMFYGLIIIIASGLGLSVAEKIMLKREDDKNSNKKEKDKDKEEPTNNS